MIKKLLKTFCIIVACTGILQAQNEAAIKIKLIDKNTKETIPFASVIVEIGGIQAGGGNTNMDGEVVIKPLNPGKYNVKATSVGYQKVEVANVMLSVGKTSYINVEMIAGEQLQTVEIIEWKKPLIDPDTKTGGTVDRQEYQHMAAKAINSVVSTTAGVYQADEGSALNVRGSRTDATAYYVDGQKVVGNSGLGLPQSSIDQVTTIVGGTPAEYGDAVGGIISITTRGPESKYSGGIEVSSSGLGEKNGKQRGLDAYGYNFLGFSLNGPILFKKDTNKTFRKALLGFSINGQITYEKDPAGPATDFYQIKSDKYEELKKDPVRLNPNGNGYVFNSQYLTMSDMERIKARNNVDSRGITLSGKILYQPTTNLGITLGGSYDDAKRKNFVYENALLNYENNPRIHNKTYRGYAKITQKFNTGTKEEQEKSSSIIKNAYFTLQGSFMRYTGTVEPGPHGENYFDYGYVGKFEQEKKAAYVLEKRSIYDLDGDGIPDEEIAYWQNGYQDISFKFTPSDKNPSASAYTQQYYNITDPILIRSIFDVQNGLGLVNGDQPNSVYAIWNNSGYISNLYTKFQNDQFRVFANFSADIKNHALQVGMEYEQRNESSYALYLPGLWTIMRQLSNNERLNLADKDPNSAILNTDLSNSSVNYYDFKRAYSGNQSKFSRSLRTALGLDTTGVDYINVDEYDPSMYNLNMFSAGDLLNPGGTQLVAYNGYDHTGKKINGTPTLDDFFDKRDAEGYHTYATGAYRPIYIAGYIQDKFDFKDLKFNIGLRIDRFDANQKVLKDPYLLLDAKTVGELNIPNRPANIGDDFVPYVRNVSDPNVNEITGYRHGETWYDANGIVVDDPATSITGTAGGIYPYLVDPTKTKASQMNSKAFKDYEPQVNFMPRIAFAFPISDVANFFAHYDVLTQRPSSQTTRMDPFAYLNTSNNLSGYITNPNLKPERTTDYELGFTQVLTERKNSALTISAFYRELRDQIQTSRVYQAYPNTYNSFKNIDFGTVKGFSIGYDLRRLSSGVQLTANYTLQFADGTGSAFNDGQNIVAAGQPNIRVPHPLDYDQRHTIVINLDYRFGSDKDYKGPMFTRKKGDKESTCKLLENVGANLTFRLGSGTPYSKQSNITPEGQFGLNINKSLEGAVNGSNLPWSYKIDLRIDKSLLVKWGKAEEGDKRKQANLNFYLQVLNLLNTKNIIKVYKATGNADDDGYLSASQSQNTISNQVDPNSFVDLYNIKINNPANYSRPRVIRIGVQLDF
jgi:outer membrane receptor protein involved in Fe transport